MALIELKAVGKQYRRGKVDVPVLQGIDLMIESGEILAIMGPSGSGKSSLMNIIGLLDRPTSGTYQLQGNVVNLTQSDRKLSQLRSRTMGFVFQSFHLLPHLTALQNVAMPQSYSHKPRNNNGARELLVQFGLGQRLHYLPAELSGGENQRVAIARALINDPDVVLADEPTGNLDSKSGTEVVHILKDLAKAGKTVILVTHDHGIAKVAERVVCLKDGQLDRSIT